MSNEQEKRAFDLAQNAFASKNLKTAIVIAGELSLEQVQYLMRAEMWTRSIALALLLTARRFNVTPIEMLRELSTGGVSVKNMGDRLGYYKPLLIADGFDINSAKPSGEKFGKALATYVAARIAERGSSKKKSIAAVVKEVDSVNDVIKPPRPVEQHATAPVDPVDEMCDIVKRARFVSHDDPAIRKLIDDLSIAVADLKMRAVRVQLERELQVPPAQLSAR